MTNPIRILVSTEDPAADENFYRTLGPLLAEPENYEVQITTESPTWIEMSWAQLVCVPHPYRNEDLRLLELAKAAGRPLWIDYDEDYLNVPECHPRYVEIQSANARENIITAVSKAELVTCSSAELQETLSSIPREAEVKETLVQLVRTGLHPSWPKRAGTHNRSDLFMWRGDASNAADTLQYAKAIGEGLPENSRFQIMGWFAWPLGNTVMRKTEEISYTKPLPLNRMLHELSNTDVTCVIVPLEDNAWNRAKSNLPWLEAVAAGALAIVPDWQEYQQPGVIKYKDEDSLRLAVANFMEIPYETRVKWWEESILAALQQTISASMFRRELLTHIVQPRGSSGGPPPTPRQPPAARLALVPQQAEEQVARISNLN